MKKFLSIFIIIILFIGLFITANNSSKKNELVKEDAIESDFLSDDYINENFIKESNYNKFIFFGDSRFVGMQMFASADDSFVANVGMGYDYLIQNLDNIENNYTDKSVIIVEFGINDLYNINKYIDKINELSEKYNICYLTIYPIDENKAKNNGYSITNYDIDNFNEELKNGLNENISIIDTNNYLKTIGYNTIDGIHYDDDTYKIIYDYIKNNI